MHMNLGKPTEIVRDREAWHAAVHGVTKVRLALATEQQHQSVYMSILIFLFIPHLLSRNHVYFLHL